MNTFSPSDGWGMNWRKKSSGQSSFAMDPNLLTVQKIGDILDHMRVPWFVGGSIASSVHGVPRSTLDSDIVVGLNTSHVPELLRLLGDSWYASEEAILSAIESHASFNLIDLDSSMKVDVFIPKDRIFDRGQFGRAELFPFPGAEQQSLPVASAADIVAAKLEWFRLGGEISERQWEDILGVLRINRNSIDTDELGRHADELGVADLLEKAFTELGDEA